MKMRLSKWSKVKKQEAKRRQRRLFFEPLEDRRLMTVSVVQVTGLYDVYEYDENVFVVFDWIGDLEESITVNYELTGSAVVGEDYESVPGSFTVEVDQSPQYAVYIVLKDDDVPEGDETLTITLLPGTGYSVSQGSEESSCVITDDDSPLPAPAEVPPTCPTCGGEEDQVQASGDSNGYMNPELVFERLYGDSGGTLNNFQNPDTASRPSSSSGGVVNTFGPTGLSSHPVRYSDGTVVVATTDLQSEGYGMPWGLSRQWSNGVGYARNNFVGEGMVITEQPVLIQTNGVNTLALITDGRSARYFDLVSGVYEPRDFLQDTLAYDSGTGEYVFTTVSGAEFRFIGFATSIPSLKRGQFKSYEDAAGNTTSVTSFTAAGRIEEVERSYTSGGTTIDESFLYAYLTSGDNRGLLANVVFRRRVNAGSWETVRKAEYTYYDGIEDHGNVRDLKAVLIKDGSSNVLDTTYYRYYVDQEANGYEHGLKYVFYSESYARLVEAEGATLSTIDDVDAAPFADHYFEYDGYQRATKEIAQGAGCSTCNGGQGAFEYAYSESMNSDGYNSWKTKTVETLPDGNQNIVYANYRGQVMLQVYKDTTTSDEWATFYKYDSDGRVILRADPAAVSGYDDQYEDLVHLDSGNYEYLRDSAGLIALFTFYGSTTATSSVPGGAAGYLDEVNIREGETGTSIKQSEQEYISCTAGSSTIYLPATSTVYANTNGTGGVTTEYAYTFYSGTVQIESQTTTDAASGESVIFRDTYGRPTWMKDAAGYIHYTAYDQKTGAVVKTITDVDTTETGDFTGLPSGWTTPSGGGLHLISTTEVDSLGRPTKETDANGNVTYIVYDDDNHEVRVYPGWNSSTDLPTGPTMVMREDRAGSYSEVLTMTATPTVASGRPTGAEAIGSLQSLTRTHTNAAGQVTKIDEYFSFTSLTYSTSASLGTEGTHFYRTEQAFDSRGRLSRVERADGTIYRTVYDGQSRPISEWIGTNDTPSSGFWSPTNPAGMELSKEYEYDSGNVGNSFLTGVTDALSRESTLAYDFRGRLLTTTLSDPDGGGPLASPVYATAYDNLGRVTSTTDALSQVTTYAYDTGNRTTTVTLPDPDGGGPLTSPVLVSEYDARGLLISETDPLGKITTYEYDGAGRLVEVTQPDPDGGGPLTAPVTGYQYDAVGNLRYTTAPLSHVTEQQYDRINRLVKVIQPDPDGGGVLTSPETVYAYDVAGNLGTVTDAMGRVTTFAYDRLGRQTSITEQDPDGGGPLSSPVTSFAYDAAHRLTKLTAPLGNETDYTYDLRDNVLTTTEEDPDGGGPLAAPVTTNTYDDASQHLSTTDPLGRLTSYDYDNLGRLTKLTQPDPDGVGGIARPYTTYAYDAMGRLTKVTDPLGQDTDYAYDHLGRRTSTTDDLAGVTSFTYDAAGRMLTLTDPVANTTTWTYDYLGRMITETNELSDTRSFEYDAASNLTKKTDRLGRVTEYVYDNLDRVTTELWKSGGSNLRTLSWTYNAVGELTLADDPAATYSYTRDSLGRVTSEGQVIDGLTPAITYDSVYNAASLLTELLTTLGSNDDFKNEYTYDNLLRLTRLEQSGQSGGNVVAEKRVDFAYNAAGQFSQITRYADLAGTEFVANTFYAYDGMRRLAKLLHTVDGSLPGSGWGTDPLAGYDYTYDAASRIGSIDSYLDGLTEYDYDNTNQLVAADHTGIADESYEYDENGNRVMTGHTVGDNNQLLSDGTYDYEYDEEGNRTVKETIATGEREEYTWDHRNRLTKITFKDSLGTVVKTVDQSYDIFNRWIRRTLDSDGPGGAAATDTFFSHLGQQIALEFDGPAASDLTHRYLWSPAIIDQILADETISSLTSAGTILWPLTDHLGTPRELAQYNAGTNTITIANHRIFDSYGNLTSQTNGSFTIAVGFTGIYFDITTNLNWHRARWYDIVTGQWMSEDPAGFPAGDRNLYRYTENSPLVNTDPSGRIGIPIIENILDEALKRQYHGPWKGAAAHCWAACYIGAVYGAGVIAAFLADMNELYEQSEDSVQDVAAQHFGGAVGDLINIQMRVTLGPIFGPAAASRCASKLCDTACRT